MAHIGFVALIGVYVAAETFAGRPGRTTRRTRSAIRRAIGVVLAPLCVDVIVALATLRGSGNASGSSFAPLFAHTFAPGLALAYFIVIAALVAVTRLATTTSLWVALVLVGIECEVWTEGIMAGRYYSASSNVGSFEGLIAGGAFFNVIARTVATALTELAKSNMILADRSVRDSLTNLLNRRGFDERLAGLWHDQRRRKIAGEA